MTDTTDIHALAGAYALHALNDIERAAFVRHLHDCDTCAVEETELQRTTAVMAGAVAETPPPRLRESILAMAARTPQERPARTSPGATAINRWRPRIVAAVAAAVIAVGASAVTWAVTADRGPGVPAQSITDRRIAEVLNAPDATVSTEDMRGGHVVVVRARSRDRAVVIMTGLPAPGAGRAYQLWKQTGDNPMVSVNILTAGRGRATRLLEGMGNAATFGVSLEPAAGSPTPTDIVGTLQLT
jgi:anti-sigma-K factor RskA